MRDRCSPEGRERGRLSCSHLSLLFLFFSKSFDGLSDPYIPTYLPNAAWLGQNVGGSHIALLLSPHRRGRIKINGDSTDERGRFPTAPPLEFMWFLV
jgi:hypothetical protein